MARMQLLALAATLLLAVSCASASGGRQLLDDASMMAAAPAGYLAGAPGPSSGAPPADILLTITASSAVLAADKLTLTGVAPIALHTTAGQGVGTTPVAAFANSSTGALYIDSAGQWLSMPAAVLTGMANGTAYKALVKLSNPQLNDNKSTLIFQVTILAADSSAALPTSEGVTARLVDDKANGLASDLLTSAASAPLTDAALFIDANSQTLRPEAQTRGILGAIFGGGWGGWGGGWNRGWGGGGWGHGGGWGRGGWGGHRGGHWG